MKFTPNTINVDRRLFAVLLSPSWFSGIAVSFASVLFCGGVIASLRYEASSVRVDFLNYQAGPLIRSYQDINTAMMSNSFVSNLPLLIFWSLVGLVVYLFAANIFTAVRGTAELTSELHYVHANRRKLLGGPLKRLLFRLVVAVVWSVYSLFFFRHVIPYCLAASIVGSAQLQVLQNSGYVLLAMLVMAVALHIHVVLLRLFLIRPRLFSGPLYADVD